MGGASDTLEDLSSDSFEDLTLGRRDISVTLGGRGMSGGQLAT